MVYLPLPEITACFPDLKGIRTFMKCYDVRTCDFEKIIFADMTEIHAGAHKSPQFIQ